MRGEPDLASVAALIGNPSRAAMLMALADGRALPAGELAATAGLSLSGASAHLAQLMKGGLLLTEREGRHRYYRLSGPQVATALNGLAALAVVPGRSRSRSPATEALRRGRTCYNHLAGGLGVAFAAALENRGLLAPAEGKQLRVTPEGAAWFANVFAIEVTALKPGRQGIAYRCLDWTERRHHLAGSLGALMLQRCVDLGLLTRISGSRAVALTPRGRTFLHRRLDIDFPTV
ncbi:MAG: ArsR/SmtB family transcription factor [Stellaceae bacterium]